MANLAIKGHTTRGKEVIEILEMLGGKNKVGLFAKNETLVYFIKNGVINNTCMNPKTSPFKTFTLEEFLEKFPYKVGDKVRFSDSNTPFTISRIWWDNNASELICTLEEQDIDVSSVDLQAYKEETMKETNKAIFEGNAQCCNIMNDIIKDNIEEAEEGVYGNNEINCYHQDFGDKVRIILGGDFEIKVEDKLTYIVRKKPQYPDTYEECCSVLGMTYYYPDIRMVSCEEFNLYSSFIQLIRCRDAYWKIAGEEMGLGKPWEPDWESLDKKYNIYNYRGVISHDYFTVIDRCILSFPTEEMRNIFYENFKDLIEICKELL